MPSLFSIISTAWDFYRKQSVLNHVLLWMFIVPMTLMLVITDILASPFQYLFMEKTGLSEAGLFVVVTLINLVTSVWIVWGNACVLVVGTRLVKSPAGRTRSSFQLVRRQASRYIIPLLFTDILRDCFTFLWTLLFIIPGILYRVRTLFYPIAIVAEGQEYRDALRASKAVVHGHFWRTLWYMIGIVVLISVPTTLAIILASLLTDVSSSLVLASDFLTAAASGFALMMYLLMTIEFYKRAKTF